MDTHELRPTPECARVAPLLSLLADPAQVSLEADAARDHARDCAYCCRQLALDARIDRALRRRYTLAAAAPKPTEDIMRYVTDRAHREDERPEPQLAVPAPVPAPMPGPKRSFWRGVAALGSVAALLALSLALFGQRLGLGFGLGAAPHGPAHPSFPGTQGIFAGVSMVSPTEGWALARVTKTPDGASHPAGEVTFYHYLNGAWTPVYVPTSADFTDGGPGGFNGTISMDSPADGWAVASNFNRFAVTLHYTDGAWHEVTGAPTIATLQALSPTSVWAVAGLSGDGQPMGILHFDGKTWTRQSLDSAAAGASNLYMVSLRMTSDREGWALAELDNNGTYGVLRYDGAAWTLHSRLSAGQFANFTALAMVSPSEGWALAEKVVADSSGVTTHVPLQEVLYHFANGRWSAVPLAVNGGPYTTLTGITMTSATDGWIVGYQQRTYPGSTASDFERNPIVLRYSGGQWRQVTLPHVGGAASAITGLSFAGDGGGWACGYVSDFSSSQTVQDDDVPAFGSPVLWHLIGGAWTQYTQP